MSIHLRYLVAGLLLVSACGGNSEEEFEALAKQQTVVESSPVRVMVLQEGDFKQQVLGNGKLTAVRKSSLQFEQGGLLVRLAVRNGERIRKGSVLAELDAREASRACADAELSFGKAALDRSELLLGQGYAPEKTDSLPKRVLETANIRSGYSLAESGLAKARAVLAAHKLVAPFGGTVADLGVKVENRVGASELLCSLIDDSEFEVEFKVLETDLPLIEVGQRVRVTAFATEHELAGRLSEINPVVEENGMVSVKASVANNGKLMEGMNVSVVIERNLPRQLVVPKSAVLIRQDKEVLFTVKAGRAYWTYVHTKFSNTEQVAVVANVDRGATLAAGDTVIVDGNLNLAHESSIDVMR